MLLCYVCYVFYESAPMLQGIHFSMIGDGLLVRW